MGAVRPKDCSQEDYSNVCQRRSNIFSSLFFQRFQWSDKKNSTGRSFSFKCSSPAFFVCFLVQAPQTFTPHPTSCPGTSQFMKKLDGGCFSSVIVPSGFSSVLERCRTYPTLLKFNSSVKGVKFCRRVCDFCFPSHFPELNRTSVATGTTAVRQLRLSCCLITDRDFISVCISGVYSSGPEQQAFQNITGQDASQP